MLTTMNGLAVNLQGSSFLQTSRWEALPSYATNTGTVKNKRLAVK
jgi:hypothetical protein